MSDFLVSTRYARALLKLFKDDMAGAKAQLGPLSAISGLFEEASIKRVLISPVMPTSLKTDVLSYALEKSDAGDQLRSFVKGVVKAGRVPVLELLHETFSGMLNDREGVVHATVVSAVELSDAEITELTEGLKKSPSDNIVAKQTVDESILGGFIVKIGNSQLDLSLKTKIEAMAKNAIC